MTLALPASSRHMDSCNETPRVLVFAQREQSESAQRHHCRTSGERKFMKGIFGADHIVPHAQARIAKQGPGSDEDPIIVAHDLMVTMLTAEDVHPQSNLSKNVLSGHFMFEAANGQCYAVAAYAARESAQPTPGTRHARTTTSSEPQSFEEALGRSVLECAGSRQQSHVPLASRDVGDLVAEAMGLPPPAAK